MVKFGANGLKFVAHGLDTNRSVAAVGGHVEHPDHTVFYQWTTGNLNLGLTHQREGLRMVHVRLVQQRDPDIDIEQVAHGSDALLVQQIANMFGRDDFIACREQRVLALHGHRLA